MKKNKIFFKNRTYEEILKELNFGAHLEKLEKKLRNKKVALYGAGIFCNCALENYNKGLGPGDFSKLNIVGIADMKFKGGEQFHGYKAIAPEKLPECDIDVILISTQIPVAIRKYLKYSLYKGKKLPEIHFLLNKPLSLYIEEIF